MNRLLKIWSCSFGLATGLALTAAVIAYAGTILAGKPISVQQAIVFTFPDCYFWAAVAPLLFWYSRRFKIEKGNWPSRGTIHFAAGVAVAFAEIAFFTVFFSIFWQ